MDINDKLLTEISNNVYTLQSFNELLWKVLIPFTVLLGTKAIYSIIRDYLEKYSKSAKQKKATKQKLADMLSNHIKDMSSVLPLMPSYIGSVVENPISKLSSAGNIPNDELRKSENIIDIKQQK